VQTHTQTRDYARYALGMLLAVYTLNFVDRIILGILVPSIKAELLGDPGDLTRIPGVEDISYEGTTLHAHVDSEGLGELIRVLGDTGVRSLVSQPPTLEELFMRHYGPDGQRELSDQGARS